MCTGIRFTDSEGNMYFGRNLDWSTSYGERIVVVPQGFWIRSEFSDGAPAAHAVIGMGIVFEDYPLYFDCGNDAGLAVAGLNFPGYACYQDGPVAGRTNVAAYEFPLWVAANFTTVDEVETALANTAIVAKPVSENLASPCSTGSSGMGRAASWWST
ncbi:linear amide C-N hydrolase [Actinomyces ruminis]|uniref:linear amide C-N hydrolase n=1 Tax=Actinomyces ruminis TaxID=1937003 RepID=UPI001C5586AD|nr:linear amide C-N hydrolase [Actinomyces ruminis]